MIEKASYMKVYPEKQEEYKKRHDELWPEMRTAPHEYGVIDYSIYLDPSTSLLPGYLVIGDEGLQGKVTNTPINQKWWKYMEDIVETSPDASPISHELTPVFGLQKQTIGQPVAQDSFVFIVKNNTNQGG